MKATQEMREDVLTGTTHTLEEEATYIPSLRKGQKERLQAGDFCDPET